MYRIDFVDMSNYAAILHSLRLEDGLDNVTLSGEKIAGSDYFAREPRRLEFTCIADDWLTEHIFDGNNEQIRYISNYEVRLYRNGFLDFHGIIDTSFCSNDIRSRTMRFTCYDKLRLLVKFSDLKMLYALANGYSPGYCFGYFAQNIEDRIANMMPVHWTQSFINYPLEINVEGVEVLKINWKEIIEKFGDVPPQSGSFGFKTTSYGIRLVLVLYRSIYDADSGKWSAKVYASGWRFYNTICPFLDDKNIIDLETKPFYSADSLNEYLNILLQNFIGPVPLTETTSEGQYVTTFDATNDINLDNCPDFKSVSFTGNAIPKKLFPKGFYDSENKQTEMLPVLKTALFLHNLTIVSSASGDLWLKRKDLSEGTAIVINEKDIIDFEEKRKDTEIIDTDILNILMGDTQLLQDILKEYYEGHLSYKWELNVTIDDLSKYDIQLFNTIIIKEKQYRVNELKKDSFRDEYEIVAWRTNV
ncbi:hypothetical protein [Maridesulfovibrio ferrireducens]|uniref:hypothetical protein n=1 Tax=Maridesulfovibrio ferrireducens TaxID=246191 RepID=UPI001A337924|nr:hypothetical protein [Maridesulfovibrio ferrireducens]MBI9113221.1 hypothetical protein [Maridesulfovibrio ferrireducens]